MWARSILNKKKSLLSLLSNFSISSEYCKQYVNIKASLTKRFKWQSINTAENHMFKGSVQVALTVYQSSKMRLLAFGYERLLEDNLIHDDVYIRTDKSNDIVNDFKSQLQGRCKMNNLSYCSIIDEKEGHYSCAGLLGC